MLTEPTLFDEPMPPHQRHSDTSRAAAASVRSSAASIRARVLEYLQRQGPKGATDDEVQRALNLPGSTQRPRRVELIRDGMVRDSGRKRPTSTGRAAAVFTAC